MPVNFVKSALFSLNSCMRRTASMNNPPVSVKRHKSMFKNMKNIYNLCEKYEKLVGNNAFLIMK